jgi:acetyl esterase/lipase
MAVRVPVHRGVGDAAPRHGTAPSNIALAGDSASSGLAIATLVSASEHGLPRPAAAFVMSPYADLTLSGTTMETKGRPTRC